MEWRRGKAIPVRNASTPIAQCWSPLQELDEAAGRERGQQPIGGGWREFCPLREVGKRDAVGLREQFEQPQRAVERLDRRGFRRVVRAGPAAWTRLGGMGQSKT